jgi:hypothetical protein
MLSPPTSTAIPVPSDEALRVSAELSEVIRAEIARAGGFLDFARYMELALYAPGLGYYSAGSVKLGPAGDFVTAPEISAIFGRALAATLCAELAANDAHVVLELGAGSGALAAELLDAWALQGRAVEYWILEPSADRVSVSSGRSRGSRRACAGSIVCPRRHSKVRSSPTKSSTRCPCRASRKWLV